MIRTVYLDEGLFRLAELKAGRVAVVLRSVWRAGGLVECVDSMARMQRQARHGKMTQGLLDLKRLYWKLRRFQTGRRPDQTPYGLLGLKLPELGLWEFLKLSPEESGKNCPREAIRREKVPSSSPWYSCILLARHGIGVYA